MKFLDGHLASLDRGRRVSLERGIPPNGGAKTCHFATPMTGFRPPLFGIWNAASRRSRPCCGLADIYQNSAVSQNKVVWVAYDRQAVRTRQI